MTNAGFSATQMKPYLNGFHMTFDNGWTISVQFGSGNYISDRGHDGHSADAEIAAWGPDGEWYRFEDSNDDQVLGWQSPDQVLRWMNFFANMKWVDE